MAKSWEIKAEFDNKGNPLWYSTGEINDYSEARNKYSNFLKRQGINRLQLIEHEISSVTLLDISKNEEEITRSRKGY